MDIMQGHIPRRGQFNLDDKSSSVICLDHIIRIDAWGKVYPTALGELYIIHRAH